MSSDLCAIPSATSILNSRAGFIPMGHSMGGKVVQHYAATAAAALQSRPKGLVLVALAPLRGLKLSDELKQQQRAAHQSAESVEFVLNNVLTAEPGTLAQEVVAGCVRDSLRGNKLAKKAWLSYAVGEEYGDLMGRSNALVLILRGDGTLNGT